MIKFRNFLVESTALDPKDQATGEKAFKDMHKVEKGIGYVEGNKHAEKVTEHKHTKPADQVTKVIGGGITVRTDNKGMPQKQVNEETLFEDSDFEKLGYKHDKEKSEGHTKVYRHEDGSMIHHDKSPDGVETYRHYYKKSKYAKKFDSADAKEKILRHVKLSHGIREEVLYEEINLEDHKGDERTFHTRKAKTHSALSDEAYQLHSALSSVPEKALSKAGKLAKEHSKAAVEAHSKAENAHSAAAWQHEYKTWAGGDKESVAADAEYHTNKAIEASKAADAAHSNYETHRKGLLSEDVINLQQGGFDFLTESNLVDIELLTELSKKTVSNYINHATNDVDETSYSLGHDDSRGHGIHQKQYEDKIKKRKKGIALAVKKLVREK